MQSITVLAVSRIVHGSRFLSSSAVASKYKNTTYKTIDQILHPVGDFAYRIYPEKVLYKLLYRNKKVNPLFFRPPVGRPTINIETAAASVHSHRICSSKRVRVLNKLFMRYIPEVLATSALGIPLLDYDVQFSEVKVGQYYDIVRVFWIPKGTEEDEKIHRILNQVAYPLRSELINLKLMGLVPPINFVKDKKHAYIQELEKRLRIADYGEDYVPSFVNENVLKKDLKLNIQLPQELRERISSADEKNEFSHLEKRSIPPMVINTFGLNHEKIMKNVHEGKKKAKIHNQSMESLIGKSAIKEVPFSYEGQPMESWDRKAFIQYMKNQRNKKKLIMKTRSREFADELREASQQIYGIDDGRVNVTEYGEFSEDISPDVFPDEEENFDDECSL